MTSVQERLQIKREPLDKWSIREQLCLASAVARSGDQNWMSVSRALKPFGDPNRPPDWFHQKNCAAQYGALLENVETPKRKKRLSGPVTETVIETPSECILRKLTGERLTELKKLLAEEKAEYSRLHEEMVLLQSGNIKEEQLDKWCRELDEEEQRKEQEALAHSQWLKEREQKKQEIERVWRPSMKTSPQSAGIKRKAADTTDGLLDIDHNEEQQQAVLQEPPKSALSPLLTSLLKARSQVHEVPATAAQILQNQRQSVAATTSSTPTIASLLNSSTEVPVSPGLQQLVSTAIGREPASLNASIESTDTSDLLEDEVIDSLPNLKVEDIESTILSSDEPLPEIKNEEVEVIISDLIESANADDIVNDPEQHLQLDGNVDIIANLANELKELCEEEEKVLSSSKETPRKEPEAKPESAGKKAGAERPKVDPFEFEEEPELYPSKMSSSSKQQEKQTLSPQATPSSLAFSPAEETSEESMAATAAPEVRVKKEAPDEEKRGETQAGGSVEIVEIVVEEDELDKQLNKSQIQDIVHSFGGNEKEKANSPAGEVGLKVGESEASPLPPEKETSVFDEPSDTVDIDLKAELDVKKEVTVDLDVGEVAERNTFTPEYGEEFFDMSIEVTKMDKSGKAKRDYSRTKKKEEKEIDILLAVEKAVSAQLEESELTEEDTMSDDNNKDYEPTEEKKDEGGGARKAKSETDRSNSPWTEEEDVSNARSRRRYSTPATPVDSVPNSPASSGAYFDDDREYRNWKKSVLLVYSRLAAHKYASLFMKPITDDQAPGYHSLVYRPLDLQSIRKNIENGTIRTTAEFQRDVALMFTNAVMYNKTHSLVYKMAQQMQEECAEQIKVWSQAQSQDLPVKRETRTSESGIKRKRGIEEAIRSKKRKED